MCKIRTEITLHLLVQHDCSRYIIFFYKIHDNRYILLDVSCKNFSQILRKIYKLREKFPLLPYELHGLYWDDFL